MENDKVRISLTYFWGFPCMNIHLFSGLAEIVVRFVISHTVDRVDSYLDLYDLCSLIFTHAVKRATAPLTWQQSIYMLIDIIKSRLDLSRILQYL